MADLQIDFVVSNAGHHLQTALPVIEELQGRPGNTAVSLVSLCELRGLPTPKVGVPDDIAVVQLVPSNVRRSPSIGKQSDSRMSKHVRRAARLIIWRAVLKGAINRWLDGHPDLVVLQNDVAFPYDYVVDELHTRKIPFVLVQEGVRFPLPGVTDDGRYGGNGAAMIAAWGRASANYFEFAGASKDKIHLTGAPRFDEISNRDWRKEGDEVKSSLGIEGRMATLLTNPVDDQGFCTTDEKLHLVASFVEEAVPILKEMNVTLVLKLHGRENPNDYRALLAKRGEAGRIQIAGSGLYPLLAGSTAAITMASTAGLEAMLFGLPLGVIPMPRHGFVYDYVSSSAAVGLIPGELVEALPRLLYPAQGLRSDMKRYVDRQIACRSGAASKVSMLLLEVA